MIYIGFGTFSLVSSWWLKRLFPSWLFFSFIFCRNRGIACGTAKKWTTTAFCWLQTWLSIFEYFEHNLLLVTKCTEDFWRDFKRLVRSVFGLFQIFLRTLEVSKVKRLLIRHRSPPPSQSAPQHSIIVLLPGGTKILPGAPSWHKPVRLSHRKTWKLVLKKWLDAFLLSVWCS